MDYGAEVPTRDTKKESLRRKRADKGNEYKFGLDILISKRVQGRI